MPNASIIADQLVSEWSFLHERLVDKTLCKADKELVLRRIRKIERELDLTTGVDYNAPKPN